MDWSYILLTFFTSAGISAFIIPQIILISYKKRLFDKQDERKVHTGIVPRLGGVSFLPSIVISMALLAGFYLMYSNTIALHPMLGPRLALGLCALMLLYFEGVADDLIDIGYRPKFLCQFLCAAMVVGSGIWLKNLYGIFGIHELPAFVGMPISVLFIVYVINSINLIDGIDGLASGLSMITFFFAGVLYFYWHELIYAALSFSALGALIPFFGYNVFGSVKRQRKIFMGDCGSQCVGLMLALLTLRLEICSPHTDNVLSNGFFMAVSTLIVPCFDLVRVMVSRIVRGQNPFLPDKTHIHHKFLALGMSHRTALFVILMITLFFFVFNSGMLQIMNVNIVLILDIILWTAGHVFLTKLIKRKDRMPKKDFLTA